MGKGFGCVVVGTSPRTLTFVVVSLSKPFQQPKLTTYTPYENTNTHTRNNDDDDDAHNQNRPNTTGFNRYSSGHASTTAATHKVFDWYRSRGRGEEGGSPLRENTSR